ncbi:hypothetical protein B0T16DRAFT_299762, partial [Cercophora newfieldiana]
GETLYSSRLSFFSLHRLSGIHIKWVDTLSSHLDFDPNTKELAMFRFPSICLLYSRYEPGKSAFHCILKGFDSSPPNGTESSHDWPPPKPSTQALLEETLLSYRLIFGQDRRSRALFRSQEQRAAFRGLDFEDPLLIELSAQKRPRFGPKGQNGSFKMNSRSFYSAGNDFPLLGCRLSHLQRYNMQQDSSTLSEFWADRRNPFNFYTFWAVLIVGAASILLSVLQCGIGTAQLYVA